jgi:predicted transcriptional regulator
LRQTIADHPGCSLRQARNLSRLSRQELKTALAELKAADDLLVVRAVGGFRLFPRATDMASDCERFLALRNKDRAFLHEWLLARGPCPRSEVLAHAERDWGWPVITTRQRLKCLAEVGLVERLGRSHADLRMAWLRAVAPPSMTGAYTPAAAKQSQT